MSAELAAASSLAWQRLQRTSYLNVTCACPVQERRSPRFRPLLSGTRQHLAYAMRTQDSLLEEVDLVRATVLCLCKRAASYRSSALVQVDFLLTLVQIIGAILFWRGCWVRCWACWLQATRACRRADTLWCRSAGK